MALTLPKPRVFLELTDKGSRHAHWAFYRSFVRHRPIRRLLEIGVHKGGSLLMWRHLCPEAWILGVDQVDALEVELPAGVQFRQVENAYDPAAWSDDDADFDLVVDDGSHQPDHQSFVLNWFRHRLAPGGCIIIEDVKSPQVGFALLCGFKGNKEYCSIIDRRPLRTAADEMLVVYDPC